MRKIVFIYVFAIVLATPKCAYPFDYDVDWPPSGEKDIHVLAITINGCETRFKVKDKDFYKFTDNKEALDEALEKALSRANSGCKN